MKTGDSATAAIIGILCLAGTLEKGWGADARLSESEKIESLISAVQDLKDATFIRNGSTYDCRAAADHIRSKWKWKRDEIKTARDFIRIAASASSQSGKPYLIRFHDGREVKSADFLYAELARIEAPPSSQPAVK